ncbi:Hemolysin-related protein RbmC [Labilithrix luteola]|uniref:Hemolysin-related protein RbmC n=1 Tax=Labilithrix luteola TaxID=1391654 RepID=A0A0K1PK96_9BACT|nr:VCBS repeat-containing protein [Labilithrix luteola]AKU93811.1 Hemolysin-related protein RbmC [Labilithrix luteola]
MRRFALPAFAFLAIVASAAACGSDDTNENVTPDGGPNGFGSDSGIQCTSDDLCGTGSKCVSGSCCAVEHACGTSCCGGSDVCSFSKCVTPGGKCVETSDCPDGNYCDFSLGEPTSNPTPTPDAGGSCVGGRTLREGRCLPKPPVCTDPNASVTGDNLTCLPKCEYRPVIDSFTPVVKYAWGGQVATPFASDIMMTPIVIELDDDDCDGKVTANDIPDIVFTTFPSGLYYGTNPGVLHAISVVGGTVVEKPWTVPNIAPGGQLAAGNIDGQPGNEIVACGSDGKVVAIKADGSILWTTTAAVACGMPSLADLEGDGTVEVIVEGGILDGATGAVKHTFAAAVKGPPSVSDIDGDGKLDIVTGPQAFRNDGSLIFDTGAPYGRSAIGDFDKDGKPEIVYINPAAHAVSVYRYDATQAAKFAVVRGPIDINGTLSPTLCPDGTAGRTSGGGPPTVADFDGDGTPDVALAGGVGYAVFDGKKLVDPAVAGPATLMWSKQTRDCSSAATGSTVFDFDGDGKAEVVYSDEQYFRVYDGKSGNELFSTCNTTGTLIENPVVADVDNDGKADVVVVSNAYALTCADDASKRFSGIRIFGDSAGRWVRTRRVWNEHAYHITNIEEDGTIPTNEKANITTPGLNNFRQNKQPGGEFAAPDVVVTVAPKCPSMDSIVVTVRNLGEAVLAAGVDVDLRKGDADAGASLGTAKTTRALYPAESESFVFALNDGDAKSGAAQVIAVATPPAEVHECRADNNTSAPLVFSCGGLR